MKILHFVAGDISSGAARGAYWLHRALLGLEVPSKIMTNSKETFGDKSIISICPDKKGKLAAVIRRQVDDILQRIYRNRQQIIFSTGLVGYNFSKTAEYREADIIHLHWICAGMVNIRHLAKVKKPLIWTMRDMWPMTGGCHVADALRCDRYKVGCGRCRQLGSSWQKDLSRLVYWRKKRYLPRKIKLVGISHWLSNCASQSALFQDFDVRTIHNNISTQDFYPVNKLLARQSLGIPTDKSIIIVGAHDAKPFYKGFDIFLQTANKLGGNIIFLLFGKVDLKILERFNNESISLGFLHDIISLRLAYSAADVFVSPSIIEAFGKTIAESMACGTPVVCFDATGPKDIVDHKINGYLAVPFDPADLARGIDWVLNHPDPEALSRNAREKVVRKFDSRVVAKQYIELYEEVLERDAGDKATGRIS